MSRGNWSNSATGRQLYIEGPNPADVCIEDIAISLSRICRFGGHIRPDIMHYSVAQHSVLVSHECASEYALIGLLHDAHEMVTGDIVRPVKCLLGYELHRIERRWSYAIGLAFGLGDKLLDLPADVKRADNVLLATERRDVVRHMDRPWNLTEEPMPARIFPCDPFAACESFLERFHVLTNGRFATAAALP